MKNIRELLNDGEGDNLGPVITLSLSVPTDQVKPKAAHFMVTWQKNVTVEDGFATENVNESNVIAITAQFMEAFIALMSSKGYHLTPVGEGENEVLYSESVTLKDKNLAQVVLDFQTGIRDIKAAIAAARFGKSAGAERSA